MNLSSLIVLLILVLIVGAVVFSLIRKKKNGESSCSGCGMKDCCHKK